MQVNPAQPVAVYSMTAYFAVSATNGSSPTWAGNDRRRHVRAFQPSRDPRSELNQYADRRLLFPRPTERPSRRVRDNFVAHYGEFKAFFREDRYPIQRTVPVIIRQIGDFKGTVRKPAGLFRPGARHGHTFRRPERLGQALYEADAQRIPWPPQLETCAMICTAPWTTWHPTSSNRCRPSTKLGKTSPALPLKPTARPPTPANCRGHRQNPERGGDN